jgi:sialidase-1
VSDYLLNGMERTPVFVQGTDGYASFRIPALLEVADGSLLAFCEGRVAGRSDSGNIDLVLRRSRDRGKTWGPLRKVADFGGDTVGNPAPLLLDGSGDILLLLTSNPGDTTERDIIKGRGTRRVWMTRSSDHGETWQEPANITASTKKDFWTWYATGPGNVLQLSTGRIVVPCDHIEAETEVHRSHVILSDDGGQTWRIGGIAGPGTNECVAVELEDGRVLLNMRNYKDRNQRAISFSSDGGETFGSVEFDETLIEPICQASLVRYSTRTNGGWSRILFSNPASRKRERMTVRLSYDDCKTWAASRLVDPGPSAYSCLCPLRDGSVGLLYERGDASPYEEIRFQRFPIYWFNLEEKERESA